MSNFSVFRTFVERENDRTRRVIVQALVTPWINALLYILVFGTLVGSRVQSFNGVRYLDFVLPGILMLNLIIASFAQASFFLYFERFTKHIEEILVAPISYFEMLIGHVVPGVIRGLTVGAGIYVIAIAFGAANLMHPWLFAFYAIAVAIIFSLFGLIAALSANNFEHLSIFQTFVITPLMFLGGVFNSIHMLPERWQLVARWNPFFYFVDGIRYAMIGVRESNAAVGLGIILALVVGLGALVWHLFKVGWRMRT